MLDNIKHGLISLFFVFANGCNYEDVQRYSNPGPPTLPDDIAVVQDIAFIESPTSTLHLDLYRPATDVDGDLPVVIYLFGAGFIAGDKNRVRIYRVHELTRRGYAVVSANYRLSDAADYPEQIHDAKAAVRWVKSHGAEYGLNGSRIAVWGSSAGAYLATMLGLTPGNTFLDGELGSDAMLSQSTEINAVVDFYGMQSFVTDSVYSPDSQWGDPAGLTTLFLGKPFAENYDLAFAAGTLPHVSENAPPFLIVHGTEDPTVPLSQSRLLHEALTKHGVNSQYYIVNSGAHGIGGEFGRATLFERVGNFLDQHLLKDMP